MAPLPARHERGEGWGEGLVPSNCRALLSSPLPEPTAIELSEFRQDRSADFSPLRAVLGAPERGGLKSALLNSMPGLLGPLPARASWREGVANPVSWWRYQDALTPAATDANDLTGRDFVAITLTLLFH